MGNSCDRLIFKTVALASPTSAANGALGREFKPVGALDLNQALFSEP
jgi:hypothetical protein